MTLSLLGLLDPDDESIISFSNVWSYSPSESVTSQKNGSEGNYVGVPKKRVFLSTHRSLALTEEKRHTKKRSDLKLKQDDPPRFRSVCCLAGMFTRHIVNSKVSTETAGGGDISAVFGRSGTRTWDPRSTGKGYCVEGDGRKAS